jgi:hypothetical protein
MTWGAAGPGTFPAAAIGTASPSSVPPVAILRGPSRREQPVVGTVVPPYAYMPAGRQISPWSSMSRPATTTRASMASGRQGSWSEVRCGARSGGRRWGSLHRRVNLLHEGPSFVRDLKTWYIIAYAQVGIAGHIETFIRDITDKAHPRN